jgi:hypothetical protein
METTKQRADKGLPRKKYIPKIHPKYRAHLMMCNSLGITTDFTEDDFKRMVSYQCYYCGTISPTALARIDGKDDYNYNNVRYVCWHCSMLKTPYSEKDFLKYIEKVYDHRITILHQDEQ